MDVRCERCRAQYVFDDDHVTAQGLTVQCTNCGHLFRVKKKQLVVTLPVRPEDVTEVPLPASAPELRPGGSVALPPPATEPAQPAWIIRQVGGSLVSFTELTTLQKWVVERRLSRDDEISLGDERWVRLGDVPELRSFFEVVDAAGRGDRPPAVRGATALYPPPPFPPPEPPPEASGPPPAVQAPLQPVRAGHDLLPEERAAVQRASHRRTGVAVGALLAVAVGAAAYLFVPGLLAGSSPPPPAPPAPGPAALAAPPAGEPAPPSVPEPPPGEKLSDPVPAPEPPAPRSPEPVAVPAPPPAPAGPKALLQQARRLREQGEPAKAVELFARLAATDPENVEALTGRGLCYLDLGQYHTAEASFQTALAVDPEAADALMGLAETYRSQGRKDEALAQYERYLKLHPDGDEAAVARNAISQLKE